MSLLPQLSVLPISDYTFVEPSKRIHDGADVQFFLQSLAYRDITAFILQLNRSVVPRKRGVDGVILEFDLSQTQILSPQVTAIRQLISKLEAIISDAPPDTGPRRFGNISFRKWYKFVEDQIESFLEEALPASSHPAILELRAYLLGSFGSAQRLDYGTGHELSFIAFLASLWKIGYFTCIQQAPDIAARPISEDDRATVERQIVINIFQPYLVLIRNLIITYNLEPAGSHGVWGLDDNSFLPYLFGSAQLCPAIPEKDTSPPTPTPILGSLPSSPEPSIVTKQNLVDKEASSNLYFSAIKFIYTVKRGPFWEHSPMLFDISGIKDGWGKINKGLIKMYDAEVLGKFPVVQHFPFGDLLRWERDPEAKMPQQSTHAASQPLRDPMAGGNVTTTTRSTPGLAAGTSAPWASSSGARATPSPLGFVNGVTQAPWAKTAVSRMPPPHPSQTLRQAPRQEFGTSSLRTPNQQPSTMARTGEARLASKTAESIPEEKT